MADEEKTERDRKHNEYVSKSRNKIDNRLKEMDEEAKLKNRQRREANYESDEPYESDEDKEYRELCAVINKNLKRGYYIP